VGIKKLLSNIEGRLRRNPPDVDAASKKLINLIYSKSMQDYWREAYGSGVPSILFYIDRVIFSESISTAKVIYGPGSSMLMLGVSFYLEYLSKTLPDLLFILLHERNHVVFSRLKHQFLMDKLGETDVKAFDEFRASETFNGMEDSYINGVVRRTVVSDLPERFYGEDELSTALLTNRSDVVSEMVSVYADMATNPTQAFSITSLGSIVVHLHRALYSADKPPEYVEYMMALIAFWKAVSNLAPEQNVQHIVDHGSGPPQAVSVRPADCVGKAVLRKVIPGSVDTGSILDRLLNTLTDVERGILRIHSRISEASTDQLLSVIGCMVACVDNPEVIGTTAFPTSTLSVRDRFLVSAGAELTQYQVTLATQTALQDPEIHIFFDVSSSMTDAYAIIPWMSAQLSAKYRCRVYQFSWPASLSKCGDKPDENQLIWQGTDVALIEVDPKSDIIWTSDGTSYDVVARHIIKHDLATVVVVTDTTTWIDEQLMVELRRRVLFGNLKITLIHVSNNANLTLVEQFKPVSWWSITERVVVVELSK
jgi:hypothetical protein